MKKYVTPAILLLCMAQPARADFWGGDIPLLLEIVTNTLNTLREVQHQSGMLEDQVRGINDKINRLQTIKELIRPEDWKEWKDPKESARRLQKIYYTLPPEYRTERSNQIERELSRAMTLAGQLGETARDSFASGKELERRGADGSPGVANKLTASGVGSLVTLQSQNQVAQATIISLLSQTIASSNEREAMRLTSQAESLKDLSKMNKSFSGQVKAMGGAK